MNDEQQTPAHEEPDTESSEDLEDEAPTEDHEVPAPDTQASELATVEVLANEIEQLRSQAAERDEFLDKLKYFEQHFEFDVKQYFFINVLFNFKLYEFKHFKLYFKFYKFKH